MEKRREITSNPLAIVCAVLHWVGVRRKHGLIWLHPIILNSGKWCNQLTRDSHLPWQKRRDLSILDPKRHKSSHCRRRHILPLYSSTFRVPVSKLEWRNFRYTSCDKLDREMSSHVFPSTLLLHWTWISNLLVPVYSSTNISIISVGFFRAETLSCIRMY